MTHPSFEVRLPDWLVDQVADQSLPLTSIETQMDFAIGIALRNVISMTGGPFGAAVFEVDSGRLVAAGVNLVMTSGLSLAHAEVVALSMAQRAFGHYDLSEARGHRLRLVTSAEPCIMCLGMIHWSGVGTIAAAARDADVREIGFDEGDKPQDWTLSLRRTGRRVEVDVRREAAIQVLRRYQSLGGEIYNA